MSNNMEINTDNYTNDQKEKNKVSGLTKFAFFFSLFTLTFVVVNDYRLSLRYCERNSIGSTKMISFEHSLGFTFVCPKPE
jgi:hypothetical protein